MGPDGLEKRPSFPPLHRYPQGSESCSDLDHRATGPGEPGQHRLTLRLEAGGVDNCSFASLAWMAWAPASQCLSPSLHPSPWSYLKEPPPHPCHALSGLRVHSRPWSAGASSSISPCPQAESAHRWQGALFHQTPSHHLQEAQSLGTQMGGLWTTRSRRPLQAQ